MMRTAMPGAENFLNAMRERRNRGWIELAALAAGMPGAWSDRGGYFKLSGTLEHLGAWLPLTNDGDALGLAIKLGMVMPGRWPDIMPFMDQDEDIGAATRRAIVVRAAEVGRTMECLAANYGRASK